MPGLEGKNIFFSPNFLATKAVVSPMHATALSHCCPSGIKLTQALVDNQITCTHGKQVNKILKRDIRGTPINRKGSCH